MERFVFVSDFDGTMTKHDFYQTPIGKHHSFQKISCKSEVAPVVMSLIYFSQML